METSTRIQTAIRLSPELLGRVKSQARKERRSFNSYVEAVLSKAVEWEWPVVDLSVPVSEEIKSLSASGYTHPSPEELAADPKLAYLVEKYGL